ncbi:hypothetical protein FHEFKHOI_00015 [Candidatus Methanoperedenaceae archaeon GB50]|nr:hypothetical protein FHEFKHOI_00015 [Candidatus Methanoperedenaceae archaeon GB50]
MNENTILRENTTRKISGVFLSLMICLACVAPAIATTPFVISGDVSDSSGDPCNNSVVQITNLNTNATWTVNTTAGSNHYELNLTSSDVSAGDILQIDASGCSESATVKHTVTASEINNSGFVEDITLEPSAKPDLTITGKMEEWIDLGNRTYNIVYTVENIGVADAGESLTSISIDGAVSVIGDPVPALAVGESYTSTVGPFTISDASDVIIVCADKGNVVDESNETNNCLENTFTLPVVDKPDLTITGKMEEWVDLGNRTYNIVYTVENIGVADAGESLTSISIDGAVSVIGDPVPALAVGESYTSTVGPFTISDASDVIIVCADKGNVVDESNETNNCLENTFTLPPDLTVTDVARPLRLRADVINPITATVANIGSGDSGSFDVTLAADGTLLDTVTIPSLASGESMDVEFLAVPTEGNLTLTVTADASDTVDESDETNNTLTSDVTVLETLTATVNVRIEGKDDTIWQGDVTFDSSTLTTTDGAVHYLNEPTALGALDEASKLGGFDYVLEDINGELYVTEIAGESMGSGKDWLYRVDYYTPWVEAGDFVLNLTTPPDTPHGKVLWYFGTPRTIALEIELDRTNVEIGEDYAVATVTAYNDSVSTFEPVENATVHANSLTFQTDSDGKATLIIDTAGDYTIYAEKGTWEDYTRTKKEILSVTAAPDLTVTDVARPLRLRADVINPITATVANIGSGDSGSFDVTLAADGTLLDTVTIPSLASGESMDVEFLAVPTEGNLTLTVTADASDTVDESDETNNTLTSDVTVLETLTATVNVRIEGKDDTIWQGDVTFDSSTLTTTDGAVHYLNEPTALGALDEASKLGGFDYVLEDINGELYVTEIAGETMIDWNNSWMYRVDYYFLPWVEAADFVLNLTTPPDTPHGKVLWYFGTWTTPPLNIELDRTNVEIGEDYAVATVTAYNDSVSTFEPVENATVHANSLTFQTDSDGKATLIIDTAGDYTIYAEKGTWEDYTRSEKRDLTIVSVESYGASIHYKNNARLVWNALGEPDNWGAFMLGNSQIEIELDKTVPECKDITIRTTKITFQPVEFNVAVSSDGVTWRSIGSERCDNWGWTEYSFNGNFGDVKYIQITKPGSFWRPKIMGLDAVHAKN